jgi:hypothetical protein
MQEIKDEYESYRSIAERLNESSSLGYIYKWMLFLNNRLPVLDYHIHHEAAFIESRRTPVGLFPKGIAHETIIIAFSDTPDVLEEYKFLITYDTDLVNKRLSHVPIPDDKDKGDLAVRYLRSCPTSFIFCE